MPFPRNIPVLQPPKLRDPGFLNELKSFRPDLQVIVAFRMLPREVWALPPLGTFNLHASLLPQYRGAAPINWAIINGEEKTGVTTFFLEDKIDTGEVLFSREVMIGPEENAGELHDKLMVTGADLVIETIRAIISGKARPFLTANHGHGGISLETGTQVHERGFTDQLEYGCQRHL